MSQQQGSGPVAPLPVAAAVREARAAGDHRRVARLLSDSPVEAWFAFPVHELRAVLAGIPLRTRRSSIQLGMLGVMAGQPDQGGDLDSGREHEQLRQGANHFRQRMRGAPRTALRWVQGASADAMRSASALFDTTGGLEAVASVQAGITQMLAGDLPRALASFTRVQLNPPPNLPFLARDAYVKTALIHAQFGDPGLARGLLAAAAPLPRTDSWAEAIIDAHAEIVGVLLLPVGAADAIARIESISLGAVGELWPYYVQALHRVYIRAGRRSEGTRRVETLRLAGPPAEPGNGFPGSVFETTLAEDAILRGDAATARALLARADPALVTTRFARAGVDLVTGNSLRVVRAMIGLQGATAGLRRLDIGRLALMATALRETKDLDACVDVLRQIRDHYGELGMEEQILLPTVLWPLIDEHLSGWMTPPVPGAPVVEVPEAGSSLTTRERDVLACLVAGLNRDQIAETLFISVNTVKTHQRSLFRKLGASNTAEALVAASRRGLV